MINIKVVIIVVTYNGEKWIKKCLNSCKPYPVLVIDNASTDNTVKLIRDNFSDVKIIQQDNNLGFGRANNIGISYALQEGAEYVFLLNQDAYLVDDSLLKLYNFQKSNTQYGILSPIHLNRDKSKLDVYFSEYMNKEITGSFYSDFILGNKIPKVYEVPFVNAAAWLLSRECLEVIGGFDPLFFHYGEDNNFCQRVLFHHFKIGIVPKTYVIHDRDYNAKKETIIFSKAYYLDREKFYKVKYANILKDIKPTSQISKLKRTAIKEFLKLKFKKANAYLEERTLLKSIIQEINRSREKNINKGSHYL